MSNFFQCMLFLPPADHDYSTHTHTHTHTHNIYIFIYMHILRTVVRPLCFDTRFHSLTATHFQTPALVIGLQVSRSRNIASKCPRMLVPFPGVSPSSLSTTNLEKESRPNRVEGLLNHLSETYMLQARPIYASRPSCVYAKPNLNNHALISHTHTLTHCAHTHADTQTHTRIGRQSLQRRNG